MLVTSICFDLLRVSVGQFLVEMDTQGTRRVIIYEC